MNISQMKNIIVLKDLPSNLVDEAIVILKKGSKVKTEELLQNDNYKSNFEENIENTSDIAVKEAEFLVKRYIDKLEKPTNKEKYENNIYIQNKKLKICSIMLGILAIIGITISIF